MGKAARGSMTNPELRSFDCTDHDPIETWSPGREPVRYWLTLEIGDAGHPGADLYYVPVADHAGLKTPQWKRRTDRSVPPVVVDPYSWRDVLSEVRRLIASAAAPDRRSTQELLRQAFAWEYDAR